MNLLEEYIPDYSGHIAKLKYSVEKETLEIVFFDRPEEFNIVLKLVFYGVKELREAEFERPEDNCIELAIGLDSVIGGYCLHTDQREIHFQANRVESFSVDR
ncbi:hypothetical protein [uncultured Pseudoteredinibacter sp.]|uniref:hypothetical protein n=1 Tax=uncultured Pseudoteredinibacter sp. TaxID=1641701 RepID=UPI002605B354|nr:hypothetical protein [uncultured Pseudoteredinibacter sp.]